MGKKVRVFFVRHGETYFNKYGRMQGWSDTPLTEKGTAAALKTGEVLKDTPFERVIASDLGRTIATAGLILEKSNCNRGREPEKNPAFRESFFGYYEGSDSRATYGELSARLGIEPKDFFGLGIEKIAAVMKENDPYGEAESHAESLARMKQGLWQLAESAPSGECNMLVVTHGNVIRTLVHDIDPSITVTIEIHNAGITILTYENGGFFVESFNQI